MCRDGEFDPLRSELVYGPIEKQRWIYACSKQLLDRVNGHSKSIADLERKLGGVELAPGVEFTPAPGWKAEAARPFSHGDPFRSLFDRLGEMERKLEGYSSRLDYLESNRQA